MHPQHWMDELFGSAARLRILRLLTTEPNRTWTGREIAARIGMSPNTVNRALRQLRDSWVVWFQKLGGTHAVRFLDDMELSATLRKAFREEGALVNRMKDAIGAVVPKDATCYLFGSTARRTAKQESDVDLLIVAPTLEAAEDLAKRTDEAARRVFPARYAHIALDADTFRRQSKAGVYQEILRSGIRLGGAPLESFL